MSKSELGELVDKIHDLLKGEDMSDCMLALEIAKADIVAYCRDAMEVATIRKESRSLQFIKLRMQGIVDYQQSRIPPPNLDQVQCLNCDTIYVNRGLFLCIKDGHLVNNGAHSWGPAMPYEDNETKDRVYGLMRTCEQPGCTVRGRSREAIYHCPEHWLNPPSTKTGDVGHTGGPLRRLP